MYKILLIFILIFISNVDIIRAQEIKSIQFDYSVVEGTNCFAIGSMQYELLGERRGINKNFVVTDKSDIAKISECINTLDILDIDDGFLSFLGKITFNYEKPSIKTWIYFNNTVQIGLCGAYYEISPEFIKTINDIFLKYQGFEILKFASE